MTATPPGIATPPDRLIGPAPIRQLTAALRANARGFLCAEAAIELLIKHESWLHHEDFIDEFVEHATTSQQWTGHLDTASVDWAAALAALDTGRLPCSSSESQLLRITTSLAEGIPVDLRDALGGLDTANTSLVARAICHVTGHRS